MLKLVLEKRGGACAQTHDRSTTRTTHSQTSHVSPEDPSTACFVPCIESSSFCLVNRFNHTTSGNANIKAILSNKLKPPSFQSVVQTEFAEGGGGNPLIISVPNHQHQCQQLQEWDNRLTSNNSRMGTHTHFKTSDRTVTPGRNDSVLAAASSAQPQDKISYHHSNFETHPTCILINAS